ncbi:MAG: hypothetical protein ACTSO7_03485 [Candidatus Heimdallarchaeota archaeon]
MRTIKAILKNLSGKTKKSIVGGVVAGVVIAGVVAAIFGGTQIIGVLVSAAVLAVVVVAVYFILKRLDDLPDAFAN